MGLVRDYTMTLLSCLVDLNLELFVSNLFERGGPASDMCDIRVMCFRRSYAIMVIVIILNHRYFVVALDLVELRHAYNFASTMNLGPLLTSTRRT